MAVLPTSCLMNEFSAIARSHVIHGELHCALQRQLQLLNCVRLVKHDANATTWTICNYRLVSDDYSVHRSSHYNSRTDITLHFTKTEHWTTHDRCTVAHYQQQHQCTT